MTASQPRLIVILGPTAGGKSELAVSLARRLTNRGGGEVLGADSMQVYRHLDAGTAKPEAHLRAAAPHHLIDIAEPTQRFSVADWLTLAEPLIDQLLAAGRWPIVVGGTNLYIKALLEGMFKGPEADIVKRAELERLDNAGLHARLNQLDPEAATRIHLNDRKKLVRAIEVCEATGRPISDLQSQWQPQADYRRDPVLLGLEWSAEAINWRINARVKQMFQPAAPVESLPDEVRRLEAAGLLGMQAREALGYKQVLAALQGVMSLDEAFEQTKIQTRRFAKRQRTWLKRFRNVKWLDAEHATAEALTDAAWQAIVSNYGDCQR